MPVQQRAQDYIGDGVYVAIEADSVKLHTPRDHGDHFIYMEAAVLRSFMDWLVRIGYMESWLKENGYVKEME